MNLSRYSLQYDKPNFRMNARIIMVKEQDLVGFDINRGVLLLSPHFFNAQKNISSFVLDRI